MTSAVSTPYMADMMSEIRIRMNEKLAKVASKSRFTADQVTDFKNVQILIQDRKYLAANLLLDKLIASFD